MSFNADDAALAIEMMNEEATADVQYSDQNAAMAEIERITTATKLLVANTMKLHGLTEFGDADDGDEAGAKAIMDAARAYQRDSSAYRSEEHTSELQSLMRISYAVFCLKKKKHQTNSKRRT